MLSSLSQEEVHHQTHQQALHVLESEHIKCSIPLIGYYGLWTSLCQTLPLRVKKTGFWVISRRPRRWFLISSAFSQKGKKGKRPKGKGKGGVYSVTPEGRQICYAYNSQWERCDGSCGRLHVCQACFGTHPLHMHAGESKKSHPSGGKGGASSPPEPWQKRGRLAVLYLHAGPDRKASLKASLQKSCDQAECELYVEERDILRSESQDLSNPQVVQTVISRIQAQEFDAIFMSPPCNTWSRAPHSNSWGPCPVRKPTVASRFPMGRRQVFWTSPPGKLACGCLFHHLQSRLQRPMVPSC